MSPPVLRVMRVLDYLAFHPDEEFTISELARRLSLNKATCHAIVSALLARRYLTRNEQSGRFQLGPAIIPLGHVAQIRFRALDLAHEELVSLAEEYSVAIVAAIRTEKEIVVVERFGPETIFNAMARPGFRMPLTPPLGTTYFAWSPDEAIDQWLAEYAGPQTDLEGYRAAMRRARENGVVVGRDMPAVRALDQAIAATEADPDSSRTLIEERIWAMDPDTYLLDPTQLDGQPTFIAAPVFDVTGEIILAITAHLAANASGHVPAIIDRLRVITTHMTLASGGGATR